MSVRAKLRGLTRRSFATWSSACLTLRGTRVLMLASRTSPTAPLYHAVQRRLTRIHFLPTRLSTATAIDAEPLRAEPARRCPGLMIVP